MLYVVTGAAGFIGSRIVAALNRAGVTEILAVDNLQNADKFRNLAGCRIEDYLDKRELLQRIEADRFDVAVEAVLHQGACSDTMERDGRYMMENNYRYSRALLDWCQEAEVPFLYASSAAVYGAGGAFAEDRANEAPLNVYGYSKFLFDEHVRRRIPGRSAQIAGLRYFNVYGPNEAHKAHMKHPMESFALRAFHQFRKDGRIRLFAGSHGYADGEQRRDFLHVEDAVNVNLHFLGNGGVSGIFNCGTGRAQSFNDVAVAVINAARGENATLAQRVRENLIEYIPFPAELEGKYQSYTQADLTQLRAAGYDGAFMTVEQGVAAYVKELLAT